MSKQDKALQYFYDNWYDIDTSIDYEDENVKNAIIDSFTAGRDSAKGLDEFLTKLEEMKNECLYQSKMYPDKSKRGKFRDYAAILVEAMIQGDKIKKKHNK